MANSKRVEPKRIPRRIKKPISERQRKYIKGLAKGQTKKQAKIDAGYALGTHVESPHVRAAFQSLIRRNIDSNKIAQRIAEGLDAQETKFFQYKGKLKTRNVIAWGERREYAKIATEYGGYFIPKQQIETSGPDGAPIRLDVAQLTDDQLKAEIERKRVEIARREQALGVAAKPDEKHGTATDSSTQPNGTAGTGQQS